MSFRRWSWLLAALVAIVIGCSDSSGPKTAGGAIPAGGCAAACQSGQSCVNGSCVCLAGLSPCSTGCVDTQSSAQNCGACGTVCGAGQVCSNGACAAGCAAGQAQCGFDCVDTTTSVSNCGMCGTACSAGQSCVGGVCTCPTGQMFCGASCVDLMSDAANCGSCGSACSAGATCSNGTCLGGAGGAGGTATTTMGGSAGATTTTTMGGDAGTATTTMGGSAGTATTTMGGDAGTATTTMGGSAGTAGTGGSGGTGGTTEGDWYVAVDGNDNNPGTIDQPFATVGRAQQAASPGETVLVRGGTYAFSSGTVGVAFNKAGQQNNLINYFAYAGETPIFDLSGINNPSGRVTGLDVHTSYIHVRGFEVTGVPQYMNGQDSWGVRIQGDGNVLEQLNVHHNEAPGIFITSGANNLILNCDSHHNYDVLESGGSGDGFGCHSSGGGNVIRGCRGYDNSDDGYDFINAPGTCTVEYSWSFRNGFIPDTNTAAGNGAGFKAGGYGTDSSNFPSNIPVHVVRGCVSWGNRTQGFYANHHPGPIDFFNNTAYNNPKNYDMLDDIRAATHVLRNNIAYGTGGNLSNSTSDDDQNNSWNGGVSVSDADFVSLSDAASLTPRKADGSLPDIDYLHLAAGSDLIDAGVDVGLPYNGSAPDLGAFETN